MTKLPAFSSDPLRFKKIILNLISNALKLTQQGKVTVIAEYLGGEINPLLQLKVRDTGIGIKKNDLKLLFTDFTQIDNSETRIGQETGLGLSISKHHCELLHGSIQVESELGRGTEFTVHIPDRHADSGDSGDLSA